MKAETTSINYLATNPGMVFIKQLCNSNLFINFCKVFTKARATAPSVLFLDELDALVGKRSGTSGTKMEARLLSTLLNEMDGVGTLANIYQSAERNTKPYEQEKNGEQLMRTDCGSAHLKNDISVNTQRLKVISSLTVKDVLIVAATNRPEAIDEALLRPGRIDRVIYVPPPDVEGRLQILRVHTRTSPLADDVDLEEFALNTELFSGADLENLCREVRNSAISDKKLSAKIDMFFFCNFSKSAIVSFQVLTSLLCVNLIEISL